MGIEVKLAFDLLAFISVMVLIVLGLGIIASMMGIFNFAHGEFVLLGAYTVYIFESSGLSAWAGILAAPIVLAIVGLVLERLIIRRFYAAPIIAMLGTYAIGLVIREVVRGLLGGHYQTIPEPASGVITVLGLDFSFGSALAGLAGALIVPLYQLSADIGIRFLVQAFLSVMLGGVGTFEGPVLGAAAVGGMAAGLPWLVIPVLADPLVFVIALLIVKFRPQGFITQGRL